MANSKRIDESLGLEPYPLVDLRSDLGEALIGGRERERELVLKSIEAVETVIRLRAKDKNNIGRGDHAKSLGCYDAKFTVSGPDVVRVEDRAGIAKPENLGKTFEAVVRFSNSEPKDVSDYRSVTMGLAIKVRLDGAKHLKEEFLFDGGEEQDFIAGGLETFVARSIEDYADLFQLRIHPILNAAAIGLRHPKAFTVFGIEPKLRVTSSAAPMVLEKPFWSLLPYAWGDVAVKFRFDPLHPFDRSKANFSKSDRDYQTKVVTEFLESNEICYVMKVQARPRARSDDERMLIDRTFPIEDAMVQWPEAAGAGNLLSAKFHEVARVKIERRSKPRDAHDCERLAFNPWNGLKAHQPLGSLSRARLAVYKKSELVRKKLDKATE